MGDEIIKVGQISAIELSARDAGNKLHAIREFQAIVQKSLVDGHDFGTIPGTPKPTLLKPGAEKIAKLLNLYDDYIILKEVEDWDKPFFYYQVKCVLSDIGSGCKVSAGMGSCNSMEKKYGFRWVREDQLPDKYKNVKESLETQGGKQTFFEYDFSLSKRETSGKYGKPETYWAMFDKEIKEGRAKKVDRPTRKDNKVYPGKEISVDTTMFKIPSPDIYDQVNTILKMAKKRAMVDAALSVGRLSDLFTQDIEDIYQGVMEEAPPPAAETKPAAPPAKEEEGVSLENGLNDSITAAMTILSTDYDMDAGDIIMRIKGYVKNNFKHDVARIPEDLTEKEAEKVLKNLNDLMAEKAKGKKK